VAAAIDLSVDDGSGAQISESARRQIDVSVPRRTTDEQASGYEEGTLEDADLARLEELDQEMRMLVELEETEGARDTAWPCELTSSDEEEWRNEDEEMLTLHALEAAALVGVSPSPSSVGSDDLRAMEMAKREDSDTRAFASRASGVDVSGLTAALERWSAAEPAADGGFTTPSLVCEIVMLAVLTGESRDRSRGLHVLITETLMYVHR
jgi:hypothetical protein